MPGRKKKIPVVLITGYLGSGKTTLLNELLLQEKRKVALIVNDMGSINIDARLLKQDQVMEKDTRLIELSNGCICCTLREEFMQEVEKLSHAKNIEAVFVEASGISDPASIAEAFLAYEESNRKANIYLSSIVTVVDADRIYREFLMDMQKLSKRDEAEQTTEEEDADVINLVMDQIEFCNMIVLNKCDLLDVPQLEEVRKIIRHFQPEAEILQSIRGKINAERILNGQKFDYDKAMNSSTIQKALKRKLDGEECEEEYGISSFVYEEKRPFDRERFMDFLENYPESIIRAKGYIWFADDDMHVQLFEQAGRNASVTEYSNWIAAFEEKDKQEVFDAYPEVLEEWDERYGDRLNQVVFIGRDYDEQEITLKLNDCLEDKNMSELNHTDCGNTHHHDNDGLDHSAAACGTEGHFNCDGLDHSVAECGTQGHLNCDGKDHTPAACGIEGHYNCDGKDHEKCEVCGEPLCNGEDHTHSTSNVTQA